VNAASTKSWVGWTKRVLCLTKCLFVRTNSVHFGGSTVITVSARVLGKCSAKWMVVSTKGECRTTQA
jgi:hypothetical protein